MFRAAGVAMCSPSGSDKERVRRTISLRPMHDFHSDTPLMARTEYPLPGGQALDMTPGDILARYVTAEQFRSIWMGNS